jgi:hypothetical protein
MSRTFRRRSAGHRFFRHHQVSRLLCHLRLSAPLVHTPHDLSPRVRREALARFHSDHHQWGRPPALARRFAHHQDRQQTRQGLHHWREDGDEATLLPAPHRHGLQRIWYWY